MIRLEAKRLSVTPPGAAEPAIEDRSLEVRPGERLGLAGPNGSGKTSLLLGLAGLWPSSGELLLDGVPFRYGGDPAARRRIAVIQQDPSSQLVQGTVANELAFGPRNLGVEEAETRRRVERLVDRLGLTAEAERDPLLLSAGRQQMVLIGAALATAPDLLLADEGSAHLDPEARRLVMRVLGEEAARGMAVVWASQHPEELAAMDRVLELGPGVKATPAFHHPAAGASGAGRLRVRVSPLDPAGDRDGPLVRTNQPLSLELGQSGIRAIVGGNGAGKSVILGAICGLVSCRQVTVEWEEPGPHPPIAALQFPELQIFQEQVSDEITFASISRGRPAEAALADASKWLRRLEFVPEEFLGGRTWNLSMGAKRLTEVIAALVAPSSIHLLDEPTAGLDPMRRARLAQILHELAEERPILIATQDRQWLANMGVTALEIAQTGGS